MKMEKVCTCYHLFQLLVELDQWFPTFDGLWPPSRVSQLQWPPVWLENWLQVSSQEFALGEAVLEGTRLFSAAYFGAGPFRRQLGAHLFFF